MRCRFCHSPLSNEFVDLINSPLSNSFLEKGQLNEPEVFYPLRLFVCENCFLVQIDEYKKSGEIFNEDYAYFSSFSSTWLDHARDYVESMCERLGLDSKSFVIEVGSNDGYLLQYFQKRRIPCLGIEPTKGTAQAAREKGIDVLEDFFGTRLANSIESQGKKADLLIGNNVLAHVPDLNDFVAGMKIVLKPEGVITVEFPHLMRTMEGNQFDQIYQEHYCYYSLHTLLQVFDFHGMTIFDVDEITTHGGSLRIYIRHKEDQSKPVSANVTRIHQTELEKGYNKLDVYKAFAEQVRETKRQFLEFLIQAKREGKQVVGYGAPGKGNTLLNYCGVRTDFIDYTVDRNLYKHYKYLPGTHIPVFPTEQIGITKPDYIVIMPWNLKDEISAQLEYTREWGAKLVVPIPELTVF